MMVSCHRGICCALFAMLPALLFAALMLPEPIAFAGSSVLEIEPPSHEDSRHPAAAPNQKLSNRETNQGCDSQKASDDNNSDDNNSADDANAAQNSASADGAEASPDGGDNSDAADSDPLKSGAYSKKDSRYRRADSDA